MRRQKAIAKYLAVSLGLALAAPYALASAPTAMRSTHAGLSDLADSATLLDAWREYALASLTPDFDWASTGEPVRAPSLFDRGRGRLLPPASHFNASFIESGPLHVAMSSTMVSDTPLYVPASGENLLPSLAPGLQRYIIAPSISQRLGNVGAVTFSAIFA
jgi:hypothetical protein